MLLLLPAAAVPAFAITTIVVPTWGIAPPTSYAAVSAGAHAADLVAGLGGLAAGLLAWAEPRTRRLGVLAVAAGALWFAPDWEGWEGGPSIVRSLAAGIAPLLAALLAHLVLVYPTGRLDGRAGRWIAVVLYVAAVTIALGQALVRDPFLDVGCWRDCLTNSFLVHRDPGLASALDDGWAAMRIAAGTAVALVVPTRMLGGSPAARRLLAPALAPACALGGAEIAYGALLLARPVEDPRDTAFLAVFFARSIALAAAAVAITWAVARQRRVRTAVARLAARLGERPAPGTLSGVLAAALGDPQLAVVYQLPDGRYIDAAGMPASGAPAPGRVATPVRRAGREVAVVVHDAALLDESSLEREIGGAARLAVDNERLQAEVFAQVADLRASRARIVEAGDAERRRLERDLHDGAQQRLLALSYDLRLAHASAVRDGNDRVAGTLAAAVEEAVTALGELRDLAHGIYPAILTEAGLGPALATLADTAPLPVGIRQVPDARFSATLETATYVTIAELVDDAVRRGASHASVGLRHHGHELVVSVSDDGMDRRAAPIHVVDRVGALGGAVRVKGTSARAVIPCA